MKNEIDLSQLITTKISHDLAGVIGAIRSSLEFLDSDNSEMKQKSMELLKLSSQQTISRLIFFRQTYGTSKSDGEANLEEIKTIASDYLKDSKVTLNFHEKFFHIKQTYISSNIGKLILCLIQHSYSSLIHGGEINISIENSDQKNLITISACGHSPKMDIEKSNIINGNSSNLEISVQNCLSFYAKFLSQKINAVISVSNKNNNQIDYRILF
jgi:hypothetical protein